MKKFHEIHLVRDSPERLLAISSDFHLGQKFGVNFFSKGHSEMKIGAISEQFSEPFKLSGGGNSNNSRWKRTQNNFYQKSYFRPRLRFEKSTTFLRP